MAREGYCRDCARLHALCGGGHCAREAKRDTPVVKHAVFHADLDRPVTLVTAECGAVATFRKGAQSDPRDFAFVMHPHMKEATCFQCQERMHQRERRGRRKRERAGR